MSTSTTINSKSLLKEEISTLMMSHQRNKSVVASSTSEGQTPQAAKHMNTEQKELICMLLKLDTLDRSSQHSCQQTNDRIIELHGFAKKHNIAPLLELFSGASQITEASSNDNSVLLTDFPSYLWQAFQKLDERLFYFDMDSNISWKESALVLFKECYKFCEFQLKFQEKKKPSDDQIAQRAYNLLALFGDGTIESVIANWEKCVNAHTQMTIDAFPLLMPPYTEISEDEEFHTLHLPEWRESFIALGQDALKVFVQNGRLAEKYMKRQGDDKYVPLTNSELLACKNATYARAEENPELAKIYRSLDVPESMFDAAVDFIKLQPTTDNTRMTISPKATDNIPDVLIKISDKIYMVKLPYDDPRALILGHLTNCCQSINSNAKDVVKDGVTLPNSGFYVFVETKKQEENPDATMVLNNGRIIGQSYAWLSNQGNLVLDSLEILPSHIKKVKILETLEKFRVAINEINKGIEQINLGRGGGTLRVLEEYGVNYKLIACNDKMIEGTQYSDSFVQHVVYLSAEKRFKKLIDFGIDQTELLDIQNHDLEKFNLLMSYEAVKTSSCIAFETRLFYQVKKKLSKFISLDTEKIKLLISDSALNAYATGCVNVLGLEHQSTEIIKLLISDQAIKAYYSKGDLNARDLVSLNTEKITLLISDRAIEAYATGYVKARGLLQLNTEKIELLISHNAIEAYSKGYVKVGYLLQLNTETIKLLISDQAIKAYSTGCVKVVNLVGIYYYISEETIELLISDQAIKAYSTGCVKVGDLLQLNTETIKLLISDQAIKAYNTYSLEAIDFKEDVYGIGDEVIKLLISNEAINIYSQYGIKMNSLVDTDIEIVKLIIRGEYTDTYSGDNVGIKTFLEGHPKLQTSELDMNTALETSELGAGLYDGETVF